MMRLLFVCLGNICRSAAAEAVLRSKAEEKGIKIEIDSAGILNVHEGDPADYRMRQFALRRGYHVDSISRPVKTEDFEKFDLIIGMDDDNCEALKDQALTLEEAEKVHPMSEFFTHSEQTYVPDPYYGGAAGFELVMDLLEEGCDELLHRISDSKKI